MAPLGTILASAAAMNLTARNFSYHDNAVRFRDAVEAIWQNNMENFVSDDELFSSGTFTVKDFSISSGQDPQTKNHIGDTHTMKMIKPDEENKYLAMADWKSDDAAYPGFTFTAGRHKTTDVANFWNSRISATKNTFSHTADELNFVFIGDLTVDSADCGHTIFPDIGLAQGSDDNGSNWWFGGTNCDAAGSNKVNCQGYNSHGYSLQATFQRGGRGLVNDVFLTNCAIPSLR